MHFELFQCIDGGLNDVGLAGENIPEVGIVIDAIEQKIVLQRTRAVGSEAVTGFDTGTGFTGCDSRSEQGKLGVIAAVEGQSLGLATVHQLAQVGGLGFQQRGLGRDRYHLLDASDREGDIDGWLRVDVDHDRTGNSFLESRLFRSDLISSDFEWTRNVVALLIGLGIENRAPVQITDADLRTDHDRAGGVTNRACNRAGILLGPEWKGTQDHGGKNQNPSREAIMRTHAPSGLVRARPMRENLQAREAQLSFDLLLLLSFSCVVKKKTKYDGDCRQARLGWPEFRRLRHNPAGRSEYGAQSWILVLDPDDRSESRRTPAADIG